MVVVRRGLGVVLCAVVMLVSSRADAASVRYFLMAERPGSEEIGDSYVLPISNWSQVFEARYQIRHPHQQTAPRIAQATIARGFDGVNRNLSSDSDHPWKWHVTEFQGFNDSTIEIYDSTPTWVHFNIVRYMRETGGVIGFWNYQVVAELPNYQPTVPPRLGPPDVPSTTATKATATTPAPIALPAGLAMLAAMLRRRR